MDWVRGRIISWWESAIEEACSNHTETSEVWAVALMTLNYARCFMSSSSFIPAADLSPQQISFPNEISWY